MLWVKPMRFFSKLLAMTICLLNVALWGQAVEQAAQDVAFDWRAFRDRLNAANPGLNLTDRNFLSCERLVVREHYVDGESEQTPMGKGYTNRLTISRPPKPVVLDPARVNTKGVDIRTLPKRPKAGEAEKLVDASPLSDAPLLILNISGTSQQDLLFLGKGRLNQTLCSLNISDSAIQDFSVLSGIPHLKKFVSQHTPGFRTLAVLGPQTAHLNLKDTGITELDFKYPESIVTLSLMDNHSLRSFGGLKNAMNLRYLSVHGGILPERLECRSDSVDLHFYQCKGTAFPKLDIQNIPVLKCVCNYDMADLSALQGKKIGWLVVSRCAFLDEENLTSLASLDVELLSISFYKDGDPFESTFNDDIEAMKKKLRPLLESPTVRGVHTDNFLYKYRGRLRDIGYTTDKNGNRVKKPESSFTRQEREDAFVQFLYPSPRDVFRVEIHGVEDVLKVYEEAAKPVDLSAILQRKKTP